MTKQLQLKILPPPKMAYRFKAIFSDINLEDYSIITTKILSISSISIIKGIEGGALSFVVEDEITGELLRSLQTLLNASDFLMQILHLDGTDKVVSSFVLKDCCIDEINYGALDYFADLEKRQGLEHTVYISFKALEIIT